MATDLNAVDYWCNAFVPNRAAPWAESIESQGVPLKLGGGDDDFAEPPAMLARMDALGIRTLVCTVCDLPSAAGVHDFETFACRPEEIADAARLAPGRFVGQWSINPEQGIEGVERAAEMLEEDWCVGLHTHTHSFDRRFDSADYYPYYTLAADCEVPVVMQAGSSGGLMPSECGKPIGIDRPALYFSNTDFVLSHTGWPWVDEAIAMALKFSNVYLGTATYPPRRWPAAIVDFARGPGRHKLLFGTGYPIVGHGRGLAQLRELDLPPETILAVAGENARDVFPGID
jgi:predicted TIM-barrel fold metal-dependent hydrolase